MEVVGAGRGPAARCALLSALRAAQTRISLVGFRCHPRPARLEMAGRRPYSSLGHLLWQSAPLGGAAASPPAPAGYVEVVLSHHYWIHGRDLARPPRRICTALSYFGSGAGTLFFTDLRLGFGADLRPLDGFNNL